MRRQSVLPFLIFCVACLVFAQTSPAAEPIKLNFLEVMTSPARTAVLKDLIAKFEAEHPNISINLISPPYEQADNKLTLMMNAREPLDIVEVRELTEKHMSTTGCWRILNPV